MPGSFNLMGGEGFVIKMRPVDTVSVDDMGINANIDKEKEKVWRWLKMACGENPKVNTIIFFFISIIGYLIPCDKEALWSS